jgi:hypothetical protein
LQLLVRRRVGHAPTLPEPTGRSIRHADQDHITSPEATPPAEQLHTPGFYCFGMSARWARAFPPLPAASVA